MIVADDIDARRTVIAGDSRLRALLTHLVARAQPLIDRMPPIPAMKAMLSRDGGTCPTDGSVLAFDPWSPDQHRCPSCGVAFSGPRHDAHWARAQHLWLAERAAHLATVGVLEDLPGATARARDILASYFDRYHAFPNRDNVLGPGHLFFSTYLESIWILNYLAAATILREVSVLDEHDVEQINAIADEAATLIGEFDEGLSNRQTWHAAALTAIAVWFGDEELGTAAITGRTGLLGHLADGFGDDGVWHEGENYHLFAMRGLITGLHWARAAGVDLLGDPAVADHFGVALQAPIVTALPDFTFPARKDSRFRSSLAHPMHRESWSAGASLLGSRTPAMVARWMAMLQQLTPPAESMQDAYLHDTGHAAHSDSAQLSWWSAWTMQSQSGVEQDGTSVWDDGARVLEDQGLAVIRDGERYVALECTGGGTGHSHPDRLHLTLHDHGVHWLADPGTGSYLNDDLFWYRSTLAHNAPRLGGADQAHGTRAHCSALDRSGAWSHVRGEWGPFERTIITGPHWIVDVLTFASAEPGMAELAWHPAGQLELPESVGDATIASRFASGGRVLTGDGSARIEARVGDRMLTLHLGGGQLVTAAVPGRPGTTERGTLLLQRMEGVAGAFINVLDTAGTVTSVERSPTGVVVHDASGTTAITVAAAETVIATATGRTVLTGLRPRPRELTAITSTAPPDAVAYAPRVPADVMIDGTLDSFDLSEPLLLEDELCYFRSEVPYPGAEQFSAQAWLNWDIDTLYIAIDVTTSELVMREADALPLALDNEPDDIHADGVQVHVSLDGGPVGGVLLRPTRGGVVTRAIGAAGVDVIAAGWQPADHGYVITAALSCPGIGAAADVPGTLDFDLQVNEMYADRLRRAGQLSWSGGPGWIYLRGDRADHVRLGRVELLA